MARVLASITRTPNKDEVFWNRRIGKPMRSITYFWYDFRSEAGITDVRLHDLRHTFASHTAIGSETLP